MKKILLSIIYFIACICYTKAQVLYGTTSKGGNDNGGTITEFIPATNNLIVAKSFEGTASSPLSNFIQAANGKLYWMTWSGGSSDDGVILSFDPFTSNCTTLMDFDGTNGANPRGSFIQASDGKLYGMTVRGGLYGAGVIFSFDPSTSTYKKLNDFDNYNGANPYGSLIQATNGKLYGMTENGGSSGYGVIFSFDPYSSTYVKLMDFNIRNGAYPLGTLMQATDEKLYGITDVGGSIGLGNGVIFSFDPSTSTYTKLMDFDNTNGADPQGSLTQASNGKVYGMTSSGGSSGSGVIFSFDPSTGTYAKLKDFDSTHGCNPYGSLMQASDGKLYGMTAYGGSSNAGVIFSFDPSSASYAKLKDFDNTHGGRPFGNLMQAIDRKLYGMTAKGGNGDDGVIFSFDPAASIYTMLKDLGTNESGYYTSGSLIRASDGNLYGMTTYGGSNGSGVIFSFNPSSSTYTKLKDFDYTNGANPQGDLMQARDGKLYGVTTYGGSKGYGVIFSFNPSTSAYTKLSDFDYTNGANPQGSLIQASDARIYGITANGGSRGYGVIFSFNPSAFAYTKLRDFDNTNGANPEGGLIQISNRMLYGITAYGGSSGYGVIFSFDPSTSTYTKLKDFDWGNGASPFSSLMQARDGRLYGVTWTGGSNSDGVIFSFDPSSSNYTKLKDFDDNGANPAGSLMQAANGKLYGMTWSGGSSDDGVIFSFDPSSSTYVKLKDFNYRNGANPYLGSFVEVPESGPLPVALISFTGKNNGNTNELTWKVDIEQNLNYYQLQRSIDGQNFSGISQIRATGNSTYIYNDQMPVMISSFYYYRLKSVDNDGNFKYSEVIKIRADLNGKFAIVNPNPFKDRLMVTIQSLTQDEASFIITDVSGRQLYREIKLLSPGTNIVQINEGKLSKGTYLLTIIESQQTQSIKVIRGN